MLMLPYLFLMVTVPFVFMLIKCQERFRFIMVLLILNVLSVILTDVGTLRPRNGTISGNGNPGLLVLILAVPILVTFLWLLSVTVYKSMISMPAKRIKKYLYYSSIGLAVGFVFQGIFLYRRLMLLENFPYHPFKGEFHVMVNQYTNHLFFNGAILGILVFAVVIASALRGVKTKRI